MPPAGTGCGSGLTSQSQSDCAIHRSSLLTSPAAQTFVVYPVCMDHSVAQNRQLPHFRAAAGSPTTQGMLNYGNAVPGMMSATEAVQC